MTQTAPAPARIAPWKRRLLNLAVLGFTSLVCLVLLELACRVAFPYYDPRNQVVLVRNDDGVVTGPPGARIRHGTPKGEFSIDVAFNAAGFRDAKELTAAGSNDLFAAGDSFSMGWGVAEAERYSNVLEKKVGTPAFNISIPEDIRGYQNTIAYAQRHGAPVRHVILGLCMENDLWDYTQAASTHASYAKQMYHNPLQRLGRWFKGRSTLWSTVSYTLQRHAVTRGLAEKIGVARDVDQLTHKNEYTPAVLNSSRDELLKITTNFHSVVLIIPSRALWHGAQRETEQKIHAEFVQSLRDAGVKLVDMKPRFEAAGDPLQFYYRTDPHWNARGHALAAEALAEFLAADPSWPLPARPVAPRP
ncbi:MAG: hypothetical protein HY301_10170 [Verrucomicrobia bacterium]|nr:hypothetical protein [Verrucomicrobiota bacterium]